MTRRLRAWAEAVWREVPEGVEVHRLGPRLFLAALILRPRQLGWFLRGRWNAWTTLPGDRWHHFARDVEGEVLSVRPDGVRMAVRGVMWRSDGSPLRPSGPVRVINIHDARRTFTAEFLTAVEHHEAIDDAEEASALAGVLLRLEGFVEAA